MHESATRRWRGMGSVPRLAAAAAAVVVIMGAVGVRPAGALPPPPIEPRYVGEGWGNNQYGQLGDGTILSRTRPVRVAGDMADLRMVSAGAGHSLAVTLAGDVYAWGWNSSGQLGDGTTTPSTVPVRVAGLQEVVAVAAGGEHSLALKNDGTVWAWGWNRYGQLGDGTFQDRLTPVLTLNLTGVSRIAAGGRHSLAVAANLDAYAWGDNSHGQLGSGFNPGPARPAPARIYWLEGDITYEVAAGNEHSMAYSEDRYDSSAGTRVWAWGDNAFGQLGAGDTAEHDDAVVVRLPKNVRHIAAGGGHSVAAADDGTVLAWGYNVHGQIGRPPDMLPHPTPVQVPFPAKIRQLSAGDNHTAVLTQDGTVYNWGCLVGDAEKAHCSHVPWQVAGLSDVQWLDAGGECDLVVRYLPKENAPPF